MYIYINMFSTRKQSHLLPRTLWSLDTEKFKNSNQMMVILLTLKVVWARLKQSVECAGSLISMACICNGYVMAMSSVKSE